MSLRSVTARKLVIASVCAACFVVCCGLAWWQWQRYSSAGGSFQNLGYVLQWPLFGLFPLFAVWRIRKLNQQERARRSQQDEAESEQARGGRVEPPAASVRGSAAPARPSVRKDTETDDALAEYNRYLAELNARDREET
ncbi:glucitol operon activator-like protein [Saccharomonospora saliphila]|uniref:glucitol operon activator-like protein n=1 Tax=Saccharomonospora saliphila TaxID=369829 RepID=UPI00048FA2E5|nr:glucitol operon activator-like protein [Saccharomonospora saliphila]